MKLTGTVLRCSSRKVNSSSKETYVTNLLVLDPENSSGTNYAVEAWDDKPRQVALMSEVALTVIGVVSRRNQPGRRPRLRRFRLRRRVLPLPQGGKRAPNLRRGFGAKDRGETTPLTIPFTTHPCGWLLRVGLEGG
jgi:hypothetical protein